MQRLGLGPGTKHLVHMTDNTDRQTDTDMVVSVWSPAGTMRICIQNFAVIHRTVCRVRTLGQLSAIVQIVSYRHVQHCRSVCLSVCHTPE